MTMKRLKSLVGVVLTLFLLFGTIFTVVPLEVKAMNNYEFTITGYDVAAVSSGITLYPNPAKSPRIIKADTYGFRNYKLMIFDARGKLVEAGGELLANADGTFGSPQTSISVPSGGFAVAFAYSNAQLMECYNVAFEGAMLYNATMTIVYDMNGKYDKSKNKLYISYEPAAAPSANAKKFLFVGNSTTYFNGTPLKFKALCREAGIEVTVDYCTFGSAYLSEFADPTHQRGIALRNALTNKKYDYVVLQDAGSSTYASSKPAVETILPLIRANGATPLLYMRYSAASTTADRESGAKTHYLNYSKLAEDYGLTYAPVAIGFYDCSSKYPDIRLYGDDNSHHSCEGSYLIAATWLYAFLGVSPVGNDFTAYLPSDTVTALQKTAVDSVDNDDGSFASIKAQVYVEDGVTYENIAMGKKYVPSGGVYSGKWTDTNSDGNPLYKFTDGVTASAGDSGDVGCYSGTDTTITIDLLKTQTLKRFTTDLYGNSGWGIPNPDSATVTFSISQDGVAFTELSAPQKSTRGTDGSWITRDFTLNLENTVQARYVRVRYVIGGNFCWVSEIQAFGLKSSSVYIDERNMQINGAVIGTKASDLKSELKAEKLTDSKGAELISTSKVGTGNKAIINGKSYEIVIIGDISGDGSVTAIDYLMLKRAVIGTYTLAGAYAKAGCIGGGDNFTSVDYLKLKRIVLGTYTL